MQTFIDQLQRKITLPTPPKRIISLVPSQTELLYDLGLSEEVVGITKFCIHPAEWFKSKTRIGGTKQHDFERIAALKPDLIIGNKEENEQAQIEALMVDYPVWMSDIYTIEDSLDMIRRIGELVGRTNAAEQLAQKTATGIIALPRLKQISVAYFIWRKPYMVAASDTFVDAFLEHCGFRNVFADKSRYPTTDLTELARLEPQVLLLSSEPYPFQGKHIEEFQAALPNTDIRLVDGEAFSWYGSRLFKSLPYLHELLSDLSK